MENRYLHQRHLIKQNVINLLFKAMKSHYEWSYLTGKIEYCSINDTLIIDYREFKDMLIRCDYTWISIDRHISLDLSKLTKIYVY